MLRNLLRCLPLICMDADKAATEGGTSPEESTAGAKKLMKRGRKATRNQSH